MTVTEMVLERNFDTPLAVQDVIDLGEDAHGCFDLHGVRWHQSFLAAGGRRLICWLSAADAESVRLALRQSGVGPHRVWQASVHDAAEPGAAQWTQCNVAVERVWDDPVLLDDIQAVEDAGAHCLQTWNVRFSRTFFARDRTRMVCLYQAPDAESVRMAQRQAGMPFERIWAFTPVLTGG